MIDLRARRITKKIQELGRAADRADCLDELHQHLKEKADMKGQEIYTVEEVAELLRVTQDSVRRWIRAGDLDASKLGRGYRIDRPALERFWKARGGSSLFAWAPDDQANADTTAAAWDAHNNPPDNHAPLSAGDVADFFATWGAPGMRHYSANVCAGFVDWCWDVRAETLAQIEAGPPYDGPGGLACAIAITLVQSDDLLGRENRDAITDFITTWGAELATAIEEESTDD